MKVRLTDNKKGPNFLNANEVHSLDEKLIYVRFVLRQEKIDFRQLKKINYVEMLEDAGLSLMLELYEQGDIKPTLKSRLFIDSLVNLFKERAIKITYISNSSAVESFVGKTKRN